ncbi:MAG: AMP-binding protein [Armatimonadetes bacterium]|nr:AMP-binding protein [Armatimonadota bacterium]
MIRTQLNCVRDLWDNNQLKFPNKTAVIFEGQSLTYREVSGPIDRLRAFLEQECGVKQGDRVTVLAPNCLQFYIAYWAIMKLGGVVVPVNVRLRGEEMRYILDNSDAEVFFVHKDLWEHAKEVLPGCPNIKAILSMDFAENSTIPFEEAIRYPTILKSQPSIAPEDLAIVMHTSGTTGQPKGAMMRHCDLLFNLRMTIIAQSFRHEDIHLLFVPFFHASALYSILPSSAYLGSTVLIAPRPEVRELATLIQTHKATTFFGVPTLFHFLTTMKELDTFDLSSLRLIAYAGSMMPVQTIQRLRQKFPHVELHNFFGLTETISMTHVLPDCDVESHPESIGKLLPEVWQKIIDDDGNETPAGVVGELCFMKENVIPGYWKRPGLLEEAMVEGWFRTGDLAMVDEDGYVYLKGRKKEMIIVGGENVYALEVENVLLSHVKVQEAAIIGVPATGARTYLGEVVKAFVVLRPGETITELEVKRHCAERLASYKVPQLVEFRDALPRNPGGKVMKRLLV